MVIERLGYVCIKTEDEDLKTVLIESSEMQEVSRPTLQEKLQQEMEKSTRRIDKQKRKDLLTS
jgi:transposase